MTAQIMTRPSPATTRTEDANRRLGQHLLDVVRRQDAAIPYVRRAPRTVAEMRARIEQVRAATGTDDPGDDACGLCGRWTACTCGRQAHTTRRAEAREA